MHIANAHKDFSNSDCRGQFCAVIDKVWGKEEWIVNNSKYCGKRMLLKKGYRCSLHYHKIKEETFYIVSGKMLLEVQKGKDKKHRVMGPGEIAHVAPDELHRFTGLEDTMMMEFSTHHMEEDSYRVESSGKIDLSTLQY